MLKQFACDMDFYDDRDSAPSQEETASAHSECTAHLVYLVFLFFGGVLCVCLASSWVINLPVTFQLVRLAEIQFRDLVIEATPE